MIKSFNCFSGSVPINKKARYIPRERFSKSLYQETFNGVKRYPLSINKGTPWQARSDLRVRVLVHSEVQNGSVVDVPPLN